MKDLKFRVWDKKMIINAIPLGLNRYGYYEKEGYENVFKYSFKGEIMQYTGIQDKNGVDIYEGDLIKVNGETIIHGDRMFEPSKTVEFELISEVVYNESIAGFDLSTIDPDPNMKHWGFYGEDTNSHLEVIGNIHKNVELLKTEV